MRVALVVARFPAPSELFIADKVLHLLDRGLDVHVVADRVDAAGLAPLIEDRGPALARRVHQAPIGSESRLRQAHESLRSPQATARSWARLPRRRRLEALVHDRPLLELRPDVVHTEFVTLAVRRTHLPRVLGCPLTTSIRGFDVTYAGLEDTGFYDEVWPSMTAVHVLGRDLEEVARRRGCPADLPTTAIPPAVSIDELPRAGAGARITADRPLRLLSIGRLHWKKAHHHTMTSLRTLLDGGTPARLTIVGDGPELEALAFTRHQLGLDRAVDLVGALPRTDARGLLAEADLFVHSAVTEGWSNAVLEAQGAGLPVVCSDAEGLAENVDHGHTGLVVARRDPPAMAAAIAELAGDPERRRRMGAAARKRASAFTAERQTDAFVRFYEGAVELGPADPS